MCRLRSAVFFAIAFCVWGVNTAWLARWLPRQPRAVLEGTSGWHLSWILNFSPDSRTLAFLNSNTSCVQLWDADSGRELLRVPLLGDGRPDEVCFSPDSRFAAVPTA